jgi:outer membrane protein
VQLSQAKLLLLDAQNDAADAMASLNTVLGSEQDEQYTLVDETTAILTRHPRTPRRCCRCAFTARPDLAALNDNYTAARQFSTAERDLWMPTVSALAAAGHAGARGSDSILVVRRRWRKHQHSGLQRISLQRPRTGGKAARQCCRGAVRNLRDVIARDLRTAVLNAQNAFQRIGVTQEMLNESNMALDLSQARYKIGLSGIVELTQAQLAQTQAEIAYANARYAYQTALAVLVSNKLRNAVLNVPLTDALPGVGFPRRPPDIPR